MLNRQLLKSGFYFKSQRGQSLVELVIWGALFMIFLFAVPMIIKMADIKHKHYESVRYGVWERTVWTNGMGNGKTDAQIRAEMDGRIMGHPSQALTQDERQVNPFWSHRGRTILEGEENNSRVQSIPEIDYKESPNENPIVAVGAYKGLAGAGSLGLNGEQYVSGMSVSTSILDRYDPETDNSYELDSAKGAFSITSAGSILSDEWTVLPQNLPLTKTEENSDEYSERLNQRYKDRIDRIVVQEANIPATTTGSLLANALSLIVSDTILLGEGKKSYHTTLGVYPEVVHKDHIERKP